MPVGNFDRNGNDPQGGTFQGSGGPTDDSPPRLRRLQFPLAARDVTLVVDRTTHSWTFSWRDLQNSIDPIDMPNVTWVVGFTPARLATFDNHQAYISAGAFDRATVIGTFLSLFNGRIISLTQNASILTDGYLQVRASASNGMFGPASAPLFLSFTTGTGVPNNVSSPLMGSFRILDPDSTESIVFFPSYSPPTDPLDFAGVHIHVKNFDTNTQVAEMGSLWRFSPNDVRNSAVGVSPAYPIYYPQEAVPFWHGTVSLTNGSAVATRASGPGFPAIGIVGRIANVGTWYYLYPGSLPNGAGALRAPVAVFTDGNHITLASTWPYANGTYDMLINNQLTFYYVGVGFTGKRVADPTTAPSFAL